MIYNRMIFLNTEYYDLISQKLNEITHKLITKRIVSSLEIADIGCSEGYYFKTIKKILYEHKVNSLRYWGLDIPKEGIKATAKQRN